MKKKSSIFRLFKSYYNARHLEIMQKLGYSMEEDETSANILGSYLKARQSDEVKKLLNRVQILEKNQSSIVIVGPALSDFRELQNLKKYFKDRNLLVCFVAADGIMKKMIQFGLPVDFLFTDLDGITAQELISYDLSETFCIVHAHGDNIPEIKRLGEIHKQIPHLVGTTQTTNTSILLNPGGFTDGDRPFFFFHHLLNPDQVFYYYGFDFTVSRNHTLKSRLPQSMETYLHAKNQKLAILDKNLRWLTHNYARKIKQFDFSPSSLV